VSPTRRAVLGARIGGQGACRKRLNYRARFYFVKAFIRTTGAIWHLDAQEAQ
jgi:hypothetical protein